MKIFVGVHPGGQGSFAVSALYWQGHLAAHHIATRSHSGVSEVLNDIIGIIGEWGELTAIAVDSPLTCSDSATGWRSCDELIRETLPKWASKKWLRSPNAMPGAICMQGMALVWSIALEVKNENIPKHQIFETHPRVSLVRTARDHKNAIIGYRGGNVPKSTRLAHIEELVNFFIDSGILKIEEQKPKKPGELEALVSAITALGAAFPESGLVVQKLPGEKIRPVGKRSLIILNAIP